MYRAPGRDRYDDFRNPLFAIAPADSPVARCEICWVYNHGLKEGTCRLLRSPQFDVHVDQCGFGLHVCACSHCHLVAKSIKDLKHPYSRSICEKRS